MVVYRKSGLTLSGNVGCQVRALVSFLTFFSPYAQLFKTNYPDS